MILNDEGMYVVNEAGGQTMVVDAAKMMGMFGDMDAAAPSVAGSKVISLAATGQREVVAGISGEIYRLEYFDSKNNQAQTTDLVLSDDPRAIELSKAMSRMASSIQKAAGQNGEESKEFQQHMSRLNKGVLRYGNDMWVTRISDMSIDDERFVLPAAPQDISGMADIVGLGSASQVSGSGSAESSAGEPQQQGMVSSILSALGKKGGDQAERQQDRVEDKSNQAVDEATDEAVDNVLDKALGKLFGR